MQRQFHFIPKKDLVYKDIWYIIAGKAEVTLEEQKIILAKNQAIDIALGELHRIENIGNENLQFIEVQTGDYFGEDDIERLEDDFGRIK